MDERCILATVVDNDNTYLVHLINIYAPANARHRITFYHNLRQIPQLQETPSKWIVLGDFNLHINRPASKAERPIHERLRHNFWNCSDASPEQVALPTFRRNTQQTIVDYIFGHHSLATQKPNWHQHVISSIWSDHTMIAIDFLLPNNNTGLDHGGLIPLCSTRMILSNCYIKL